MSLFVYTGLFWYLYKFLSIDIQTSFALNLRSHFRFARIYRRNFARRTSTQKKSLLDYLEKRTDSWTIFKKKRTFPRLHKAGTWEGSNKSARESILSAYLCVYVCKYKYVYMYICVYVCKYVCIYLLVYIETWVVSHIWMSHGTPMNESWHTYEWVMAHILTCVHGDVSRVTHMDHLK